ncbi:unnamed protein product [Anisakis simplex]|uniref:Uncharacterized protein n=1 Tax=Anisakis simplex TaxID=6269 RepID=A0A3P6R9B0_ANISI|nr:unnamed protein product [Anisakis simplex]
MQFDQSLVVPLAPAQVRVLAETTTTIEAVLIKALRKCRRGRMAKELKTQYVQA